MTRTLVVSCSHIKCLLNLVELHLSLCSRSSPGVCLSSAHPSWHQDPLFTACSAAHRRPVMGVFLPSALRGRQVLTVDKSSVVRWWCLPDEGILRRHYALKLAASAVEPEWALASRLRVLSNALIVMKSLGSQMKEHQFVASSRLNQWAVKWIASSILSRRGVSRRSKWFKHQRQPHCTRILSHDRWPGDGVLCSPCAADEQPPQLLAEAASPFVARVLCADVSPDGRLLMAGDQSGAVTAFRVSARGLVTPTSAFRAGMPGLSAGSCLRIKASPGAGSGLGKGGMG